MKVLFIQPPWGDLYGNYKSAAKTGNAFPPLGICYLSAVLKEKGINTKIIDPEMEGKTIERCLGEIGLFKPDYVCITSTSPSFHIAEAWAEQIRKKYAIPIIAGGPHVTVLPKESLAGGKLFDFAVYGEGEEVLLNLLECLDAGKPLDKVPNLIYKDQDARLHLNPPKGNIEDLDRLPVPDREGLNLDCYSCSVPEKGMVRFTTLLTSRGCPFSCIFCSAHSVFGRKVRNRSIDLVLDEIEFICEKHKIRHFALIDDTLMLDHSRVYQFCNGIIERKLDITWEGWTRADTVNEDILKIMKKAGFVRISFGIESGCPEILKHIRKGVKLEDYVKGYNYAAKLGIETRGSIMLGHPYETKDTILKTLKFIRSLKNCQQMYINITTPYPGTELYEMAKKEVGGMRLLTEDLSQYRRYGNAVIAVNDLTPKDLIRFQRRGLMMFYFTLPRIFYNLKRAGFRAAIKNVFAFVRSVL